MLGLARTLVTNNIQYSSADPTLHPACGRLVHCFNSADLYQGVEDTPDAELELWRPCPLPGAWCESLRDRLSAQIVNAALPTLYGSVGYLLLPEAAPVFCSFPHENAQTVNRFCDVRESPPPPTLRNCAAWCSSATCNDLRCSACDACAPGAKDKEPERVINREWVPEGCLPGCGAIGSGYPQWCGGGHADECAFRGSDTAAMIREHFANKRRYNEVSEAAEAEHDSLECN